jgi:hypothetical protein
MVTSEGRIEGANFSVTPNHQMVIENYRTGKWSKVNADALPRTAAIPVGGWSMKRRGGHKTANLARLIGLVLADGCLSQGRYVRIAQKNRLGDVRRVIAKAGYRASESVHRTTGVTDLAIGSKKLHDKFAALGMKNGARDKRVPSRCFGWGRDAIKALIEGLLIGDGRKDGSEFFSTSRGLADDLQALCAIVGQPTTLRVTETTHGFNGPCTLYRVKLTTACRAATQKLKIKTTKYYGRVRCVTVPNGTLIVRRGGRPMVCGNCLWLARSPRGTVFVYRQLYKSGMLVSQHARTIMDAEAVELDALNKRLTITGREPLKWLPFAGTFGDHDAEGRATLSLETAGEVGVERAIKDVDAGIQTVYEYLQPQEGHDGIRRARLYIIHGCLMDEDVDRVDAHLPSEIVGEFHAYRYPAQPADKDKPSKDAPVKQHDHALDALRYGLHTLRMRSGWT